MFKNTTSFPIFINVKQTSSKSLYQDIRSCLDLVYQDLNTQNQEDFQLTAAFIFQESRKIILRISKISLIFPMIFKRYIKFFLIINSTSESQLLGGGGGIFYLLLQDYPENLEREY